MISRIKSDNMKTLDDWKKYTLELETLLLLRPIPPFLEDIDEQWIQEYDKWWKSITEFWFEDEQDDYEYAEQKNFD